MITTGTNRTDSKGSDGVGTTHVELFPVWQISVVAVAISMNHTHEHTGSQNALDGQLTGPY